MNKREKTELLVEFVLLCESFIVLTRTVSFYANKHDRERAAVYYNSLRDVVADFERITAANPNLTEMVEKPQADHLRKLQMKARHRFNQVSQILDSRDFENLIRYL